jgi:peptide/nickel transport system substrate-binding protein
MLVGTRRLGAALVALGLAVVVAACGGGSSGGSSNNNGGSSSNSGGSPASGVKKGGTIKIGTVGPDSYDPIEYTTVQANSALHLVYTPLLQYKDVTGTAGSQLIPGLATAVPTPTNGGKTYKFTLRQGLKYSDGEPVRASDFDNVIKRMLYLGGPWSSFFLGIKGANEYVGAKKKDAKIPGIKVNDKAGTITINLTKPDSRILYALALGNAALTPKSKSPFKIVTNNNAPPGLGPYTIHVDNPSPTHGQFTLTKNPNFNVPGIAKGNVDKIIGVVTSNVNKMTEDVISGALDYMTEDPVGDLLPQVQQKYKDRFFMEAGYPNTYYFFMNNTIPPFNKLAARQAVNYAIDSRALVRVFGGRMKPTCNFTPPNMVGYKPIQPCPWGDPNGPGNITKAKQLVQQAGLAGSSVTVWTNNKDPRPAIADYLRGLLNQIGFKASVRTLNQTVYFSTIGNKKTKAQIGFTDWYQDFPHPGDFYGQLLTTAAAQGTPSNNQGFVSDPHIDQQVDQLDAKPPEQVADGWAALDKYVNDPQHAYVAVYGNEEQTAFYSSRMNVKQCSGYPHPTFRVDWLLLCTK